MSMVITNPHEIQSKTVLVINAEGENLGTMDVIDAISEARSDGLDLVVVDSNSDKPTCKIMDFKKQEYKKKFAEKRNKSRVIKEKEVRINVGIAKHDLETKIKNINEFLSKGFHVKISVRSRAKRDANENIAHMAENFSNIIGMISPKHEVDGKPNIAPVQYSVKIIPK